MTTDDNATFNDLRGEWALFEVEIAAAAPKKHAAAHILTTHREI
jgi:hypothetical protein